ncbi:MAG: hypothetical protein GX131_19220 [candidate division WS1 bacterium]|nr:hypothetical protein [candidate division WS1 bacterium]
MQIAATEAFEEQPAPIAEFITAPEYLGLSDEVYPAIVDTLKEIFEGDYEEAALCWGIGAGKSYAASLAVTYLLHRTLCLRDPQRYYGIGEGSTISFLNMSTNGDQARRVVFGEVLSRIYRSPWFKAYKPKVMTRELRFPKNIVMISGNSAETYPLGYNVLGAVIDEASWLLESDGGRHDAAEEIYNALQRRIRSRFMDKGLLVMISSPRHRGDFLERKLEEARTNPRIYTSRRATWEVKPPGTYCGESFDCDGLQVPVEFRPEFERNRLRAMRDLGARPAEAFEPFIRDAAVLERAIDGTIGEPFDHHGRLRDGWRPAGLWARYVHVDLALKRDACGIAMAHCEAEAGDDRPTVVVDLMLQIVAQGDEEIQFGDVRELIVALRQRGCRIAQVSYDGYQSADSRQILRRKGFRVALVSVDRDLEAYETLEELLREGRLRWYRYGPVLQECKGLEIVGGTKVDHRPGGSKEVEYAVARAVSEAVSGWCGGKVTGGIV